MLTTGTAKKHSSRFTLIHRNRQQLSGKGGRFMNDQNGARIGIASHSKSGSDCAICGLAKTYGFPNHFNSPVYAVGQIKPLNYMNLCSPVGITKHQVLVFNFMGLPRHSASYQVR